ncbi:MAG: DUF2304 family protein [Nanoarchaeota archaeon]
MTPILQLIVIAFALFAWSRALLRFRNGQISMMEFSLWSLLWFCAGLVVVRPEWGVPVASFLGIGRPIDVGIYASIVMLFYLIFKIYVKLETIEREITQIVRAQAIEHRKKK